MEAINPALLIGKLSLLNLASARLGIEGTMIDQIQA